MTPSLRGLDVWSRFAELRFELLRDRSPAAVERLNEGRARFLNREVEVGRPINWRPEGVGRLWRFHLHYHEFLLEAAAGVSAADRDEVVGRAWDVIGEWIEAADPAMGWALDDAWHPFCISRRLPVWIALWQVAEPSRELRDAVLRSMLQQGRFLVDHLEFELGGNHLLENLRALFLAGSFLAGPETDAWLERSRRLFDRELERQVTHYGEHFERAPGYHAEMLAAVIEVRDVAWGTDPAFAERCADVGRRMGAFLDSLVPPDGDVPLLGDSAFDATPNVGPLLEASGCERRSVSEDGVADAVGPYFVWRRGGDRVTFDAGPVGADDLPAHAHCDLLNVEVSIDGRRLFVDSGVYGYEADEMRAYCRSTAAHNVLEVDGRNQCDVWSRFRMGRRGHPGELRTNLENGAAAGWCTHDAYHTLGVSTVSRLVACDDDGWHLVVDTATGRGRHRLVNRLHVHPDWSVERTSERAARITCGNSVVRVVGLGSGTLRVGRSWYCPEFGRREERPVLEWVVETELPWCGGWTFASGDEVIDATIEGGPDGASRVRARFESGDERRFEIPEANAETSS